MEQINLDHPLVQRTLRTMHVIILALVLGATSFAVIVLLLVQSGNGPQMGTGASLTPIAGVTAILILPAALFIPGIVARGNRQRIAAGTFRVPDQLSHGVDTTLADGLSDAEQLAVSYLPVLLFRAALFEGAALFNTVVYLLEQSLLSIGIAATLLVLLATCFPTRSRLGTWVGGQLRRLRSDAMTRPDR
jgi:hypothetical protein